MAKHKGCLIIIFLLVLIIFVPLYFFFDKAGEKSRFTTCLSNQKQIAQIMLIYAQEENNNTLPGVDVWEVFSSPYPKLLRCPNDKGKGISYVYSRKIAGMKIEDITDPASVFITADGKHRETFNTVEGIAYSLRDIRYRHDGRPILSFADGSVRWSPSELAMIDDVSPGTRIVLKPLKSASEYFDTAIIIVEGIPEKHKKSFVSLDYGDLKLTPSSNSTSAETMISIADVFDTKSEKVMTEFAWKPMPPPYNDNGGYIYTTVLVCGPAVDSELQLKFTRTEGKRFFELVTANAVWTSNNVKADDLYRFSVIIDNATKTASMTVTNRGHLFWQVDSFALNPTDDKNKLTISVSGRQSILFPAFNFGIPVIKTFN